MLLLIAAILAGQVVADNALHRLGLFTGVRSGNAGSTNFAQKCGQDFTVTDKIKERFIRRPVIRHFHIKMDAQCLDQFAASGQRLGHDHAQYLHHNSIGHIKQAQQQAAHAVAGFMAECNRGFVGIKAKHSQHRTAALVKPRLRRAGFDALGNRLLAAALLLHLHIPQRRTANRMGHHDAQRDIGTGRKFAAHGSMAVQINIFRHRAGNFRAGRLVGLGITLSGFPNPRFLGGQIAFMERDLALGAHINIDAASLALGRLSMVPSLEIAVLRDDLNIAPAILQIFRFLGFNRGGLRFPELVSIGKIAIFGKQVRHNLPLELRHIKDRGGRGNRRAAKQPRF